MCTSWRKFSNKFHVIVFINYSYMPQKYVHISILVWIFESSCTFFHTHLHITGLSFYLCIGYFQIILQNLRFVKPLFITTFFYNSIRKPIFSSSSPSVWQHHLCYIHANKHPKYSSFQLRHWTSYRQLCGTHSEAYNRQYSVSEKVQLVKTFQKIQH